MCSWCLLIANHAAEAVWSSLWTLYNEFMTEPRERTTHVEIVRSLWATRFSTGESRLDGDMVDPGYHHWVIHYFWWTKCWWPTHRSARHEEIRWSLMKVSKSWGWHEVQFFWKILAASIKQIVFYHKYSISEPMTIRARIFDRLVVEFDVDIRSRILDEQRREFDALKCFFTW